jgi:SDR family mycofactocin-dependent oxidoreductase
VGKRLQGKVALVTGAARGQGRAIALRLAQEGADIIAIDIAGPIPHVPYDSPDEGDTDNTGTAFGETVALIESTGQRIIAKKGDIRDSEALKEIVDKAVEELGGLDIIVANAGVSIPQTWDAITPETFQFTMDVNVIGTWNTVMAGAHHLVAADGGSIILTSSVAGKKMQPFMIHYTASKHAVTGMTRGFAAELGKHNIRVNSIHPGAVLTPMGSGNMMQALSEAAATNPALANMGTAFLPQGWFEPEEVASAVAFLVSDEARFITAEHLSIDAGMQHF